MPIEMTICLPAYKEENIAATLNSLASADSSGLKIRVRLLVNGSELDTKEIKKVNAQCIADLRTWLTHYSGHLDIDYSVNLNLEPKHAGVGLARRILGDEAAKYYQQKGEEGLIVYLDADCLVSPNYFQEINHFFTSSRFEAAAIHFEHNIGDESADRSIMEYEAHLRYYILMQRWLSLPYAIHTVGSSMAVRSSSYLAKGGMNRRKAGEDFYFLQKYIKDQVCGNIQNATVYPSGRESDRVPFGTGRAMQKYREENFVWPTYNPLSFKLLRPFLDNLSDYYENSFSENAFDNRLSSFLKKIKVEETIDMIKKNVSSYEAFQKRFFQFFDAFQLMKCLHFLRDDGGIGDIPLSEAVKWYFQEIGIKTEKGTYLDALREIDKKTALQ